MAESAEAPTTEAPPGPVPASEFGRGRIIAAVGTGVFLGVLLFPLSEFFFDGRARSTAPVLVALALLGLATSWLVGRPRHVRRATAITFGAGTAIYLVGWAVIIAGYAIVGECGLTSGPLAWQEPGLFERMEEGSAKGLQVTLVQPQEGLHFNTSALPKEWQDAELVRVTWHPEYQVTFWADPGGLIAAQASESLPVEIMATYFREFVTSLAGMENTTLDFSTHAFLTSVDETATITYEFLDANGSTAEHRAVTYSTRLAADWHPEDLLAAHMFTPPPNFLRRIGTMEATSDGYDWFLQLPKWEVRNQKSVVVLEVDPLDTVRFRGPFDTGHDREDARRMATDAFARLGEPEPTFGNLSQEPGTVC